MKHILDMSKTELEEFREDYPQEYDAACRRLDYEREADYTHRQFAARTPGFERALQSGDIQYVMDHEPGHNVMSAYHRLQSLVVPPEHDPTLHPEGPRSKQ